MNPDQERFRDFVRSTGASVVFQITGSFSATYRPDGSRQVHPFSATSESGLTTSPADLPPAAEVVASADWVIVETPEARPAFTAEDFAKTLDPWPLIVRYIRQSRQRGANSQVRVLPLPPGVLNHGVAGKYGEHVTSVAKWVPKFGVVFAECTDCNVVVYCIAVT
jgi:hypothetical protein